MGVWKSDSFSEFRLRSATGRTTRAIPSASMDGNLLETRRGGSSPRRHSKRRSAEASPMSVDASNASTLTRRRPLIECDKADGNGRNEQSEFDNMAFPVAECAEGGRRRERDRRGRGGHDLGNSLPRAITGAGYVSALLRPPLCLHRCTGHTPRPSYMHTMITHTHTHIHTHIHTHTHARTRTHACARVRARGNKSAGRRRYFD